MNQFVIFNASKSAIYISVNSGTFLSVPASITNFILNIPTEVTVSTLQLYLFWNNAKNAGWAALNGGQFIQVSSSPS